MADANTETCSRIKEIEMVEKVEEIEKAEEVKEKEVNMNETMIEKWTMLNASNEQSDNESSQSQETQENWIMVNHDAVLKNDDEVPKDKNKVSKDGDFSHISNRISREESFDGSDSISVITESSDTDADNRISPIDDNFQINIFRDRSRLLTLEKWKDARNSFIICALGIIIGFFLYYPSFTSPQGSQISNGIDRESFKVATYNIDNIYKELPQVKAMLSEIQARILDDTKIREHFLIQLSEIIDSSNKISNKPVVESSNSNSYPLNQLQVSLHVLSSLAFIDDSIPLKYEMNKILNMVNDIKAFYETLIFNNNTQNNSAVSEFLQSGNDLIRITSEELLSDLMEKMNKVMLNVNKKYAKMEQKLNKKLCHLKNTLPNDELLKQLTENNQIFKNYDKSCFSNHNLKKLDAEKSITERANNVKRHIGKADDTVLNTKGNKKNIQKIYDNRKNFLKNKSNETQNINNSTTADLKKKSNMHNNYNKIRDKLYEVLSYLEDARSDPSKLEQLTKNCGEKSKKSIDRCKGKDNCPQSNKIQKNDVPESDFDSTLIIEQQLNDICPFSKLNKLPEFDKDIVTPDSNYETENNNINANSKVNSTKTVLDHENSVNILTEEKRRSKQNDFKARDFTKKPLNNKNAYSKEKNVTSQGKMKNHIPKDTFNHHESKQFTFKRHTLKQNDKPILEKDYISRMDARKKQWQSDSSNWYFQRANSRKNARKDVEYQRNWYFQRADSRKNARNYAEHRWDSKRSRRKQRRPCRIVDVWNSFVHNYNKFLRNILAGNKI